MATVKDVLYGSTVAQEMPSLDRFLAGFKAWLGLGAGIPEELLPKELLPSHPINPRADLREQMMRELEMGGMRISPETTAPITPQIAPEAISEPEAPRPSAVKQAWEAWQRSRGPLSLVGPEVPEEEKPTEAEMTEEIRRRREEAKRFKARPPAEPTPIPAIPTVPSPTVPTPEERGEITAEDVEEAKKEVVAPPIMPGAPIPAPAGEVSPEQYGLKTPEYFLRQYGKFAEMWPRTSEEALRQAGIRPEEFQVRKMSPILEMLSNFFTGLARVDRPAMHAAEQARLDGLKLKELDVIFKGLDRQSQAQIGRLMLEIKQDEQARAGIEKQALMELENLPPDFGKRPGDDIKLANTMNRLSMAYRVPPAQIQKYLKDHWNPTTGKYENLYITPIQKWDMENKAKADIIIQYDPTLPREAALQIAVTGKYPEWAQSFEGRMQYELSRSVGDSTKIAKIMKMQAEFRKLNRQLQLTAITDFASMMQNLVRSGIISRRDADRTVASYAIEAHQKGLGAEYMKGEYKIEEEEKKAAIAAAKETPEKAAEKIKGIEYEGLLAYEPFKYVKPEAYAKITKDLMPVESEQGVINEIKSKIINPKEFGKPTPEEVAYYKDYATAQTRIIAQWAPSLASRVMQSGGFPFGDPSAMDTLFQIAKEVKLGRIKEEQLNPPKPAKPTKKAPK